MPPGTYTIAARWVFPVEGPPIRDGEVVVADGRIARVGARQGSASTIDLGDAAIVPGFVNAHTHLELGPIAPTSSGGLPENEVAWLARVIASRGGSPAEVLERHVARNLRDTTACGTTMLGDVTTAGLSWPFVAEAPLRAVVFSELVGLKRTRAMETSRSAFEWLASIKPEAIVAACARPGLSPHAPYSTAGWLYERAGVAGVPLCTHLAEMPEEYELLATRGGPLRAFLEDLGAWDDDWSPLGPRPADSIRRGGLRKADWLVAHGNYLEESDAWQFRPESAPAGQRVALALCPRTAFRFGHLDGHPFRMLMERGAIVCLGTDSRASSPSLSVLDEARFLRRQDPSLSGELLLAMSTIFGAWALRAETITGSLRAGKSADLAVVALPDSDPDDPHDLLFESDLPVVATAFEGRFAHGAGLVGQD